MTSIGIHFLTVFFSLFFCGLYNDPKIVAAYGLAQVFLISFLFNTNQGMVGALRTLSSQEYGKLIPDLDRHEGCQEIFKTAFTVAHWIFLATSVLFYFSGDILMASGVDYETSLIAGSYIKFSVIQNYLECINFTFRGQFQSIRKAGLTLTSQLFALPFFFAFNLIGYNLNYGIYGILMAETAQQLV